MRLPSDCDVIARAGSYEIVSTGKKVVVPAGANVAVAAGNWAVSATKEVVGIESEHGGFNLCGSPTKATTINSGGAPLTFAGLDQTARVLGVGLWQVNGKVPGFTRFETLTLAAKTYQSQGKWLTDKCALIFAQQVPQPFPGAELLDCTLLSRSDDGASGTFALWDTRTQGQHRVFRMLRCKSPGPWKEHALGYGDNCLIECRIEDCFGSLAGRTGPQYCVRQYNDSAHKVPTNAQRQGPDAYLSIQRNVIVDCSGYIDASSGEPYANGSAITIAGWLGHADVIGNHVYTTGPLGGAMVAFFDIKQGTWLTPDGNALGSLRVEGNVLEGIAGAHAQRDLVMLGSIDSLEWGGNAVAGSLKGLVLNHGGKPVDAVKFSAPNPTSARYWRCPGAKVYTEVAGKAVALPDSFITAHAA